MSSNVVTPLVLERVKKIIYNHCMCRCTVCARLKGVFWAPFHEMGFILHLQQLPKPTYVVVMRCLAQTRMCVKICKELGHQYLAQQRKIDARDCSFAGCKKYGLRT